MTWVAAGTTVAVGAYQGYQSGKAGDAAAAGQQASIDEQRRQYDQTRQDYQPWMDAGTGALNQMQLLNAGDYSSFYDAPDYQFSYDQGLQTLDRGAASRGSLYSGGADADRIAYGSGMASQNYNNYYGKLEGLAGLGQSSTTNLSQLGQGYSSNIGNSYQGMGNARASTYQNQGDIYGQTLGALGGAYNKWNQGNQASQTNQYAGSGGYYAAKPTKNYGWGG